jgi:hypothetical protein
MTQKTDTALRANAAAEIAFLRGHFVEITDVISRPDPDNPGSKVVSFLVLDHDGATKPYWFGDYRKEDAPQVEAILLDLLTAG